MGRCQVNGIILENITVASNPFNASRGYYEKNKYFINFFNFKFIWMR